MKVNPTVVVVSALKFPDLESRILVSNLITILGMIIIFHFNIHATVLKKSVLWGNLQPGAYKVGFRTKIIINRNPEDKTIGKERPVEIMIWYPANAKSGASKIKFKDYVSSLTNFRNEHTKTEMQNWLSISISGKPKAVGKDKLNKILDSNMFALPNAQIVNKRFPLIIWTMRHETFIAQSVLCEYLASHGFVVASARYAGEPLPFPWAMKTAKEKLEVFNKHLKDLEFAIKSLSIEKNVNSSKIALLNWSYAAEFSPAIQMGNSNIKLVVGLSSNPLSSFGLYQGDSAASNFKTDKLDVPYVLLAEQIGPNGNERKAPEILNQMPTDSYFVSFPKLTHGNFNVLEGMIPGIFNIEKVQSWSKGGKTAKIGYEAISQYTLYFLNNYLKTKNKLSEKRLRQKFPKNFVKVTRFGKVNGY